MSIQLQRPIRTAPLSPIHVDRLPVVPRPAVESASLASRLRFAFMAVTRNGNAVHRDARHAPPHRSKMWEAADALLDARPQGSDAARLRAPLQALRAFAEEFGDFRASGDAHLQTRIFSGASTSRPGLTELLGDVLEAAGMGRPTPLDVVDR